MSLAKELNKRITIKRKTCAKDGYGGNVESWTVIGQVWAGVAPPSLTRRRQTKQGGEESIATVPVKVRFGADVQVDDRVECRGVLYEVKHVDNVNFSNRVLILTCEALPQGAL